LSCNVSLRSFCDPPHSAHVPFLTSFARAPRQRRRAMRVFVLAIACAFVAACDTALTTNLAGVGPSQGSGSDTCAVQAVSVTPDTATLRVGQTLQPSASV